MSSSSGGDDEWGDGGDEKEWAAGEEEEEGEEESGEEGGGKGQQCVPQQQQQQVEEEEEDPASLEARRQANVKALLEGSDLAVTRAPLLAALRVTDADQLLRRPFKSPHPDAPAVSEALRRKLAARRKFVPWGSNKPFVAQTPLLPPPSQEPPAGPVAPPEPPAPPKKEDDEALPPGIEPLILWDPRQGPPGGADGAVGACVVEESAPGDASDAGDAPVEVDTMLTRWLRPHQREGVAFMFECVTGLRMAEGRGCILADDMGLGKTLQAITLMWTLLRRGSKSLGGVPIARRAIICCPTSLVGNWESECVKWLKGRVRTLALCEASRDEVTDALTRFLSPAVPYDCLIVSYETLRLHAARLAAAGPGACDLLICDEAHRLKNDQTLTNRALAGIHCARRVLLSGTPMQNHLDEFYAMCDFTNPGVLGTPAEFRRRFEAPILAGREPGASPDEVSLAEDRSLELSGSVNRFILRRTNRLLSAHLPPKVVMVVCCRLTPLQQELYCRFLESTAARRLLARAEGNKRAGAAGVLSAITALKKLANHPKLIYDAINSKKPDAAVAEAFQGAALASLFPPGVFDGGRPGRGGMAVGWEALGSKMALVAALLGALRETTDDRVVIVSNYTQTLDLFAQLCRERGWGALRLDGSTSVGKRQKLVARFNDPKAPEFVFLLSSKAGGCGLNLVGANRLVLFDPDWNPANDKQAAGRVWRDGQRKRVYVYRLLSSGSIEEKVFQRQVSKEGLQQLVDSAAGGGGQQQQQGPAGDETFGGGAGAGPTMGLLSAEQLRQLFTLRADVASDTYDALFGCGDQDSGGEKKASKSAKGSGGGKKAKQQQQQQREKERRRHSGGSDWSYGSDSDSDDFQQGGGGGGGGGGGKQQQQQQHVVIDSEEEEEEEGSGSGSSGEGEEMETEGGGEDGGDVVDSKAEAVETAAGAALKGVIPANGYRPQVGCPAEDDLRSFGLHRGAEGLEHVPDEMLRAAAAAVGGDVVTFVFSNSIAGKDFGPPPPPVATAATGTASQQAGGRVGAARVPTAPGGPVALAAPLSGTASRANLPRPTLGAGTAVGSKGGSQLTTKPLAAGRLSGLAGPEAASKRPRLLSTVGGRPVAAVAAAVQQQVGGGGSDEEFC